MGQELQGTCLEAVLRLVSSLFSLRPEPFSKDAFVHSLTRLRKQQLFIAKNIILLGGQLTHIIGRWREELKAPLSANTTPVLLPLGKMGSFNTWCQMTIKGARWSTIQIKRQSSPGGSSFQQMGRSLPILLM